MHSLPLYRRRLYVSLAIACALLDAGCAGLRCPRCPRIDPTGERCLIWPKDEAATLATVPPPATVFPAATATLPTIPGNVTAPPVTTDPVFPQPELPAVATAAPGVAVQPVSTQGVAIATPQDRLTLSPERILAPVGSEVVFKANICTTDGYTLAEQKIEWMLGRDGVGEFVEVSGKGAFHPSIFPWNAGKKTDSYLATTYTANGPHCINRGTPDPSDDVNILRGDAWVSVTSPREGTSHVTAFTPSVESWPLRKQMATIYWVDVQWTFPPATVASGGRETLTTVVKRQTDGTPLAGWIVRYEVSDGQTSGAGAGQVSEVMTDAEGRSSVQVSPTASGAASSKIEMQLVRPANFGGSDSPRLVIGNGSTIINWSGGSTYLPSTGAGSNLTPITPTTPPVTPPPGAPPVTSPPVTAPAAQPRLELRLEALPAQVGGAAPIKLTIRNTGNAPATQVKVSDAFDPGVYFTPQPNSKKIERVIGTIAANGVYEETLQFAATKGGSQCHQFQVTFAEGAPVGQQVCSTVAEAPPQRNAAFKIVIDAPLSGEQNQTVPVRILVRNTGEVPLVNIRTIEEYPIAAITPQPQDTTSTVVSGTISRMIPRIDRGQQVEFRVNCFLRQSTRATIFVRGEAETDPPGAKISTADEREIEITLPRGPGTAGAGGAAPTTGQPLAVGVLIGSPATRAGAPPSMRVGASGKCEVMVRNTTSTPQQGMAVRIYFPSGLTPDVGGASGPPNTTASIVDGMVEFTPVTTINPGEALRYVVPVNPTEAGIKEVRSQAVSSAVPAGVLQLQSVEILENRL